MGYTANGNNMGIFYMLHGKNEALTLMESDKIANEF